MQGNHRRTNIIIHGKGTSVGTITDNVTIHGEGDIEGDLDCRKLTVHGRGNMHGSVKADQVRVHGTCDINGQISANEMVIKGHLTVHGDCSAEVFRSDGAFQIDGLLNAGRIEIRQYGPSNVKEIGGEVIIVRRERGFFFNRLKRLVTDTIEGDDIQLEYTKARIVRGNRVTVGRGCEIELIEYKDGLHTLGDATVADHRRVGPGGGADGAAKPT